MMNLITNLKFSDWSSSGVLRYISKRFSAKISEKNHLVICMISSHFVCLDWIKSYTLLKSNNGKGNTYYTQKKSNMNCKFKKLHFFSLHISIPKQHNAFMYVAIFSAMAGLNLLIFSLALSLPEESF